MTVNEYSKKISDEIYEKPDDYLIIIEKAEKVLSDSKIKPESQSKFWVDLYNDIDTKPIATNESQGVDEFNKLIQAAKKVIKDKINKS